MNRADFYYALNSVLPHVGSPTRGLDWIGYQSGRFYATDGYTAGVACAEGSVVSSTQGNQTLSERGWHLLPAEAKDLLKFVRPTLKAHHDHELVLVHHVVDECGDMRCDERCEYTRDELHVGIWDSPEALNAGADALDSQVYELRTDVDKSYADVFGLIVDVYELRDDTQPDWTTFNPSYLARFAKAQRIEVDNIAFHPVASRYCRSLAIVTVGHHFVGAIIGIREGYNPPATLEAWGLQDERMAA